LKIVDNGSPAPRRNDDAAAADDSTSDEPAGEPEDVGRATNDDTVEKKEDVEPDTGGSSSLADRTRAELADLDDLDV
jgi:hypothetical protein